MNLFIHREMNRELRVVIADDNDHFRNSLITYLSRFEYLRVVGEGLDGEHAWELIQRAKPDLVLMDISMPKLNGLECTLRVKEYRPSIAIFILTLHDAAVYRELALKAGADAFIPKASIGVQLDIEIGRLLAAGAPEA